MTFNLERGQQLRDQGMELAAMADLEALALARDVAEHLCRQKGEVTTDDVREFLNIEPGHSNGQNWIGSIFRDPRFLWTQRVINSAIPRNHARMIKVWRLHPREL